YPRRPPPRSPPFPYTTLFRSQRLGVGRLSRKDDAQSDLGVVQQNIHAAGVVAEEAHLPVRRLGPHPDQNRGPDLQNLAATPKLRSEEHTSELQSRENLVCRLL